MSDTIRVLHVTTAVGNSGGIRETLRILCRHLDRSQFRTGICSIAETSAQIPQEFQDMDVPVYGLDRDGLFLRSVFDPSRQVGDERFSSRYRSHA